MSVSDKIKPKIVGDTKKEASDIFEESNKNGWKAPEGATGEDAKLVIDMGCPIKLQSIQLSNGADESSTKDLSVFASHTASGPWDKLSSGFLEKGMNEVRGF